MILRSLLIPAILLLNACATTYQSAGLTGGHSQSDGYGKLEKVVFAGNGYTDANDAQRYAIFRSAEVAESKQKPYFLMYESLKHAALGESTQTPPVGLLGSHPTAFAFVLFIDEHRDGAMKTQTVLDQLAAHLEAEKIESDKSVQEEL